MTLYETILKDFGPEVLDLIMSNIDLNSDRSKVLRSNDLFNITSIEDPLQSIVNLEMLNNLRRVNKYLEAINSKLIDQGLYISCAETQLQRREKFLKKYPKAINQGFLLIDFFYKRVFPKLPLIKSLYFVVTRGHNRVMSKAEILGRLVSCGFKVIETKTINNLTYFVAKKERTPEFDLGASYGPIFRMKRIGKEGKIVKFYKFRTMHPYAEYLQNSIRNENRLSENGKINNDYRIASWGKFFRKYWIDELPMMINLVKGDLKLFGVRPLSLDYFSSYPAKVKELRIKTKPGLIPPYYVDLPHSFDEIVQSEEKYLELYFQSPIRTDSKYLFKAAWNIAIRGKRSS